MKPKHLEGLSPVDEVLVKAYATLIMGKVYTLDDVQFPELIMIISEEINWRMNQN